MNELFGLTYSIIICGLGGFIGQHIFKFVRLNLGVILAGGIAALIGFISMIILVIVTHTIFGYPPI